MFRPRKRLVAALSSTMVALLAILGYCMLPGPTLSHFQKSGRYSIVVADNVEVRKGSPAFGALVHNLNTLVIQGPTILSGTSPQSDTLPKSGFVLIAEGDHLEKQVELAISAKKDDDAVLKAQGIIPHGDGIKYIVLPPAPDTEIYELRPGGVLKRLDRVRVTHLLIR